MNMIYDIIKNSYDRNVNIAVFFKLLIHRHPNYVPKNHRF